MSDEPVMRRDAMLSRLTTKPDGFDLLVIGGGATGAAIALDAASRGLSVTLLEQGDFGQGTSSRSTKLVHGGVRYLAQGNISLVREALRERELLRENAAEVVHELGFLLPCRNRLAKYWYGLGFFLYDRLAGRSRFARAKLLSQAELATRLPTLRPEQARGGVLYADGQFDDCRLLMSMLRSAVAHGASVVNYARVEQLEKDADGRACGVRFVDLESGASHSIRAKAVVNATGPFCDAVRKLDRPEAENLVAASQGVHVVLSADFLPGETAVIVPKTSDGRVLFIIPWFGHLLVGTTDTPIAEATLSPVAQQDEIDFLIDTAGRYLQKAPTRADVLSVFTGIRPLVRAGNTQNTAKLSRDHTIEILPSGLITITGGKWTTARKMAEDCVDRAIELAGLEQSPCRTAELKLLTERPCGMAMEPSEAEVRWYVRKEMARTVEDVLARRSRLLFLNVEAATRAAPAVARWVADELGYGAEWEASQLHAFSHVADQFRCPLPSR